ncbi:hypothetical protein HDU76_002042 [Blyttiomyces sp. JEL0837]|nr:hypothetical protein HDU76_002042 [Blyttiomyces sp. JEL0837]
MTSGMGAVTSPNALNVDRALVDQSLNDAGPETPAASDGGGDHLSILNAYASSMRSNAPESHGHEHEHLNIIEEFALHADESQQEPVIREPSTTPPPTDIVVVEEGMEVDLPSVSCVNATPTISIKTEPPHSPSLSDMSSFSPNDMLTDSRFHFREVKSPIDSMPDSASHASTFIVRTSTQVNSPGSEARLTTPYTPPWMAKGRIDVLGLGTRATQPQQHNQHLGSEGVKGACEDPDVVDEVERAGNVVSMNESAKGESCRALPDEIHIVPGETDLKQSAAINSDNVAPTTTTRKGWLTGFWRMLSSSSGKTENVRTDADEQIQHGVDTVATSSKKEEQLTIADPTNDLQIVPVSPRQIMRRQRAPTTRTPLAKPPNIQTTQKEQPRDWQSPISSIRKWIKNWSAGSSKQSENPPLSPDSVTSPTDHNNNRFSIVSIASTTNSVIGGKSLTSNGQKHFSRNPSTRDKQRQTLEARLVALSAAVAAHGAMNIAFNKSGSGMHNGDGQKSPNGNGNTPTSPASPTSSTSNERPYTNSHLRPRVFTTLSDCKKCNGTQFLDDGTVCRRCEHGFNMSDRDQTETVATGNGEEDNDDAEGDRDGVVVVERGSEEDGREKTGTWSSFLSRASKTIRKTGSQVLNAFSRLGGNSKEESAGNNESLSEAQASSRPRGLGNAGESAVGGDTGSVHRTSTASVPDDGHNALARMMLKKPSQLALTYTANESDEPVAGFKASPTGIEDNGNVNVRDELPRQPTPTPTPALSSTPNQSTNSNEPVEAPRLSSSSSNRPSMPRLQRAMTRQGSFGSTSSSPSLAKSTDPVTGKPKLQFLGPVRRTFGSLMRGRSKSNSSMETVSGGSTGTVRSSSYDPRMLGPGGAKLAHGTGNQQQQQQSTRQDSPPPSSPSPSRLDPGPQSPWIKEHVMSSSRSFDSGNVSPSSLNFNPYNPYPPSASVGTAASTPQALDSAMLYPDTLVLMPHGPRSATLASTAMSMGEMSALEDEFWDWEEALRGLSLQEQEDELQMQMQKQRGVVGLQQYDEFHRDEITERSKSLSLNRSAATDTLSRFDRGRRRAMMTADEGWGIVGFGHESSAPSTSDWSVPSMQRSHALRGAQSSNQYQPERFLARAVSPTRTLDSPSPSMSMLESEVLSMRSASTPGPGSKPRFLSKGLRELYRDVVVTGQNQTLDDLVERYLYEGTYPDEQWTGDAQVKDRDGNDNNGRKQELVYHDEHLSSPLMAKSASTQSSVLTSDGIHL